MTDGISLAVFGASETKAQADAPSLASLVADYTPLLFRVAHNILRNRAEAEDVVQDTFVRVLQQQHKGKLAEINDHRVWLVRIAWNLALDRRRRVRPEQIDELFSASLASATTPADTALDEAQKIQQVLRCIDALPRLEREVLLLTAVEELDTAAIAAITGKSLSACRALLFRARTHLKQRLQKGAKA